eukprot:5726605-Pyramimonas_sp.AAC.1
MASRASPAPAVLQLARRRPPAAPTASRFQAAVANEADFQSGLSLRERQIPRKSNRGAGTIV